MLPVYQKGSARAKERKLGDISERKVILEKSLGTYRCEKWGKENEASGSKAE